MRVMCIFPVWEKLGKFKGDGQTDTEMEAQVRKKEIAR